MHIHTQAHEEVERMSPPACFSVSVSTCKEVNLPQSHKHGADPPAKQRVKQPITAEDWQKKSEYLDGPHVTVTVKATLCLTFTEELYLPALTHTAVRELRRSRDSTWSSCVFMACAWFDISQWTCQGHVKHLKTLHVVDNRKKGPIQSCLGQFNWKLKENWDKSVGAFWIAAATDGPGTRRCTRPLKATLS